jgi:hypothetical protein
MCGSTVSDELVQDAGQIERRDQRREIDQRAQPIGADGESHGAERADRRDLHDHADDAEEHLGRGVDGGVDLLTHRAEPRDGDAGQDRDQQHLQQVAARQRAEEAVGDDPQ